MSKGGKKDGQEIGFFETTISTVSLKRYSYEMMCILFALAACTYD